MEFNPHGFDPNDLPEDMPEFMKEMIRNHSDECAKHETQTDYYRRRTTNLLESLPLSDLHTLLIVLNAGLSHPTMEEQLRAISFLTGIIEGTLRTRHTMLAQDCADCDAQDQVMFTNWR